MKIKHLLAALLSIVWLFSLCACGDGTPSSTPALSPTAPSSTVPSPTEPASEPVVESEIEAEVENAILEGELVEIDYYGKGVYGKIIVPDGWTHRVGPYNDFVDVKCDDGVFRFALKVVPLGVIEGAMEIASKTVAGYEMVGRLTADGMIEYSGDMIGNYRIYLSSSDLDMESAEICAILDTIVITID